MFQERKSLPPAVGETSAVESSAQRSTLTAMTSVPLLVPEVSSAASDFRNSDRNRPLHELNPPEFYSAPGPLEEIIVEEEHQCSTVLDNLRLALKENQRPDLEERDSSTNYRGSESFADHKLEEKQEQGTTEVWRRQGSRRRQRSRSKSPGGDGLRLDSHRKEGRRKRLLRENSYDPLPTTGTSLGGQTKRGSFQDGRVGRRSRKGEQF